LFYQDSLERLGIDVSVRSVDSVQYENRLRNWDFDIVVTGWEETLTPGNELRDHWGSRAAATPGSRNLIGIADKAVDLLIDRIVYATDRAEQVAATHALDRVLLWHHYVVPQWSFNKVRTARWNRFAKPDVMPTYGMSAFPDIWWWDAQLPGTADRVS
jgi:microcin C transport system substrate-binding protein